MVKVVVACVSPRGGLPISTYYQIASDAVRDKISFQSVDSISRYERDSL